MKESASPPEGRKGDRNEARASNRSRTWFDRRSDARGWRSLQGQLRPQSADRLKRASRARFGASCLGNRVLKRHYDERTVSRR